MGRVANVRPHPNGEHIWLADVDIGRPELLQIVWGGIPILEASYLVPVAPPGSWLPAGKIRRRNYRGQASNGMLCSLADLGWDLSSTDCVAIVDDAAGLKPGEPLDGFDRNWQTIVRSPIHLSNGDGGAKDAGRLVPPQTTAARGLSLQT